MEGTVMAKLLEEYEEPYLLYPYKMRMQKLNFTVAGVPSETPVFDREPCRLFHGAGRRQGSASGLSEL